MPEVAQVMSAPLSFLYETQTILRATCNKSAKDTRRRTFSSIGVRCERWRPHRQPRGSTRVPDRQTQADISPGYNPTTTLTPVEDQKFRAIFESAAKGLPPPSRQSATQRRLLGAQQEEEAYKPGESLDSMFDNISKDALKNEASDKHGRPAVKGPVRSALPPSMQAQQGDTLQQLSPQFPLALQSAWRDVRRAVGLEQRKVSKKHKEGDSKVEQPHGWELGRNTGILQEQNLADIVRIRGLFESAQTDAELWAVLDAHVFSQIIQLVSIIRKRDKPGKKNKKSTETEGPPRTYDASEARVATMIQATYPVHMLNALRTLRTKFPRSLYALAIVSRVKDLDPVSQVLGLSTELYNELLYIVWRQHSDIFECARIMEDMHAEGLLSDYNTNAIFRDAEREMEAVESSNPPSSTVRCAWWKLAGVQHAMAQWREAKELLDARAYAEKQYQEEWRAEQRESHHEYLGSNEAEVIALAA